MTTTTPPIRTSDLLASEWIKLRSVRATPWTLAVAVLLTVGMTAVATGLTAAGWDTMDAAGRAAVRADPVGLILQPGASYGQIAICVLGVLAVSGEYSSGLIRSSLLAVPRRTPLLAAKAAVLGLVVLAVGELTAIPSFLVGQAFLRPHVAVSLGDPGVLRAVLGLGLYLAVTGVFRSPSGP